VDDQRRPLPERHIGEIRLGRPVPQPGLLQRCRDHGTNDTGRWLLRATWGKRSSKGELFVCGRVKDLIIVNGRKYHPQDLEWVWPTWPESDEASVVAFGTAETGRPIAPTSSSWNPAAQCRRGN
jgi:fatty-acyl-CoA synthase